MAIISAYPVGTPAAGDYLVGSDITTAGTQINPTKNFVISDVVATGLGYTSYAALLTQNAANPPVATVLKNDTGVTLTWARTGVGTYTVTAPSGIFTSNKTMVFVNQGGALEGLVTWIRTSATVITIQTWNGGLGGAAALADSLLGFGGAGAFEIRIYT